jgi:TatD DNase family protein
MCSVSNGIVDIGVNLAGPGYKAPGKIDEVVAGCEQACVRKIVCISNDMDCSVASAALTETYPGFAYCTLGLHPKEAGKVTAADLDKFVATLRDLVMTTPGCVAIGECGLNSSSPQSKPKPVQLRAFKAQVALAKELGAPLYLHCRNAFGPMMTILREEKYAKGVVHCFTGTAAQAREVIELGLYIGVTGWLLDKARNADLVDALSSGAVPLSRLLVETDAPWLSVDPSRPSEPGDTWTILAHAAELLGVDAETARSAVVQNFADLFEL